MKKQITILDTDNRNVAENLIQTAIMTLLASTINKMREVNAPKTKVNVEVNDAPAIVFFVERYKIDPEFAVKNFTLADFFYVQKEFVQLDAFNPAANEFIYHNADLKFSDAPRIARLIYNAAMPVYVKTQAQKLTFTIKNEF